MAICSYKVKPFGLHQLMANTLGGRLIVYIMTAMNVVRYPYSPLGDLHRQHPVHGIDINVSLL